jgi:hypothetical protein
MKSTTILAAAAYRSEENQNHLLFTFYHC